MVLRLLMLFILTVNASAAFAQGLVCKADAANSFACEIFVTSCKQQFNGMPEVLPFIKNCDGNNEEKPVASHLEQCLKLVAKPTLDAIETVVVSLAKAAKNNLENTKTQIELCQDSKDYREFMISKVPVLKSFADKAPDTKTCSAIFTEFQNWSLQQKQTDAIANVGDIEIQKLMEELNTGKQPQVSREIFHEIWEKQKDKFGCLTNYGKTYLGCYYAFSVVTPTAAVGLGLKAAALLKAFKLEETLSKLSRVGKIEEVVTAPRTPTQTAFANLERNLGRKPTFVEEVDGQNFKITAKDGYRPLGYVRGSYNPRTGIIDIDSTASFVTGKGVNYAVVEAAANKFPDATIIRAFNLIEDNRNAVQKALADGKSLEEAIKDSPMYKAAAQQGFTEIVPGSINSEYGFRARRP